MARPRKIGFYPRWRADRGYYEIVGRHPLTGVQIQRQPTGYRRKGPDRAAVDKLAADLTEAARRGPAAAVETDGTARRGDAPLLLHELMQHYITAMKDGPSGENYRRYRACIERHYPRLYVHELSPDWGEEYWTIRKREVPAGKAAGPKRPPCRESVNKEIGAVRQALKWADRQWRSAFRGKALRDVLPDRIKLDWLSDSERAAERAREKEVKALRKRAHEVDDLWRIFEAAPRHLQLFIWIALETGARQGAILELTWDAVDPAAPELDFGGDRITKRRPEGAISRELWSMLLKEKSRARGRYIVDDGRHAPPYRSIRGSLQRAAEKAGLTDKVTPHDLKHSLVTHLLSSEKPLAEVAKKLRTSPDVLYEHYFHLMREQLSYDAAEIARPDRLALRDRPEGRLRGSLQ